MRPTLLRSVTVLAFGVFVLAATADDKKDDKARPAPSGVWVLSGGEPRLDFSAKGVLKVSPHGDSDVIILICEYTVGKDGRINAKLTELEGKEEIKEKAKGALPVGLKFSFTWQVKDGTATLGDLKGDKTDSVKAHLEGKYEQKK